jgi:hypothetical protein
MCFAEDKLPDSKGKTVDSSSTSNADDGAKVKADKDKVTKALSNDEAAWIDYLQQYGAGSVLNLAAGPKTRNMPEAERANTFKNNFKAALREMDRLNKEAEAAGEFAVAFGINSEAHLDAEDYAALRTVGLLHDAVPDSTAATSGRKLKQACTGNVPYTLGSTTPVPTNWLNAGYVTPVKNQVRFCANQPLRVFRCIS